MTTNTYSSAPTNATAAQFRVWGKAISDALAAIGMVQTADTGQAVWASATPPGTANLFTAYEVWRFNDTLQATAPLFFKLEYGSSTADSAAPQMRLTIGTGSSGAGVITGVLFAATTLGSATGLSSTTLSAGYASSGDGSMCAVVPFTGGNISTAPHFIIDRSRDSAGVATGSGITVECGPGVGALSAAGAFSSTNRPAILIAINYATAAQTQGIVPVMVPRVIGGVVLGSGGSLALAAISPVFPWACYAPGLAPWQSLAALSWVDDPGGTFTARVLGSDRTYRSIPLNNSYPGFGWAIDISTVSISYYIGLAILWQ